ncbi:MAG: hypothetical protein ACR2PZ_20475 [Pseudomonadales bacterium]
MSIRIAALLEEIRDREAEIAEIIREQEANIAYRIEGTKVRFEAALAQAHRQFRTGWVRWLGQSEPRNVVSAPIIYSMIVPMIILDCTISLYQALCFPLYRIEKVVRNEYIVVDRHRLSYLNIIEKINCVYCGYVAGLLGYCKAIVARTEQYWCPIKHARKVRDTHSRYVNYAAFGDAQAYPVTVQEMRKSFGRDADDGCKACD